MPTEQRNHDEVVVEQFTRQAMPFSEAPQLADADAFRLFLQAAEATPNDTVLDVACGPGLTACAFATVCRHVTGIDLTPAMIERAEQLARSKGLANVAWQVGSATQLPFADAAFSIVFTRYSFHHMTDPRAAFAEMVRVCAPGGRVVVVDTYTRDPAQADAFNRLERLRDPSHVRALALPELEGLFHAAGMTGVCADYFRVGFAVGALLRHSFPEPGDAERVRAAIEADVGRDSLGVSAEYRDGELFIAYSTVALAGRKPKSA